MNRPRLHYPFRVGWTALLLLSLALFQLHCGGGSSKSTGGDTGNITQDGTVTSDADTTTGGQDQTGTDQTPGDTTGGEDTTGKDLAGEDQDRGDSGNKDTGTTDTGEKLDVKGGEDIPPAPVPGRSRFTSGSGVVSKGGIVIRGDVVWTSSVKTQSMSSNGSIVIIHSIHGD